MSKLEDMTLEDLLWQYRRQLHIHTYRQQRDEDTTDVLRKLDALANRIIELGGQLPE